MHLLETARTSKSALGRLGMDPKLSKSSRHAKITGDFGEALVLYWLSKYGFECARVDHTGIDLIARKPKTKEVMGISVKSRSRLPGTEQASVTIRADDFQKADFACEAFGCVPYFAVVVDTANLIRVFLIPGSHLKEAYKQVDGPCNWKMSTQYMDKYYSDPEVMIFQFQSETVRWWQSVPS